MTTLSALTASVAQEVALNGITVNAVCPGVIDTEMQAQLRGADAQAFPDRGLFVRTAPSDSSRYCGFSPSVTSSPTRSRTRPTSSSPTTTTTTPSPAW